MIGSQVGHEGVEPFLVLRLAQARQLRVNRRRHRAAVPEVDLNLPQVLALLQQMRRIRMPQAVNVHVFADAAGA